MSHDYDFFPESYPKKNSTKEQKASNYHLPCSKVQLVLTFNKLFSIYPRVIRRCEQNLREKESAISSNAFSCGHCTNHVINTYVFLPWHVHRPIPIASKDESDGQNLRIPHNITIGTHFISSFSTRVFTWQNKYKLLYNRDDSHLTAIPRHNTWDPHYC
jgi:hypothetical protein